MATLFDRIYAHSPAWLQNIGISAYGWVWRQRRLGGNFRQYVSEFESRDSYSIDEWQTYQTKELRHLLLRAFAEVPYYRNSFMEMDLQLSDLENFHLSDLPRLPLLTKETLRIHSDQLLSRKVSKQSLNRYYTSGTTGTPLVIYYTDDMDRLTQAAYEVRVRRWAGVNYRMGRAMIGGRLIVPQADARPPFWRYNFFEKQVYMSAFHISLQNTADYVHALNRFRPEYYVGYASSLFFLAQNIEKLGMQVHTPKAVLTSSDKLTDEMRATLQRVYRCPVFDGYSGLEACCQATECEKHEMHLSPDMGVVELVDESGYPVQPGEVGEIVATGLLNHAQPLIRYRTGDLAALAKKQCSCGRSMPVISELFGRREDTLMLPDGRRVASFYKVFQGIVGIREAQVIQENLERITILIVPDKAGFPSEQHSLLLQNIYSRYGMLDVNLQFVAQIERTARGKFRQVISRAGEQSQGASL